MIDSYEDQREVKMSYCGLSSHFLILDKLILGKLILDMLTVDILILDMLIVDILIVDMLILDRSVATDATHDWHDLPKPVGVTVNRIE